MAIVQNPRGLPKPTRAEASRFLAHATLGYTKADIDEVCAKGYALWLDDQAKVTPQQSHWAWLLENRTPVLPPSLDTNKSKRTDVVDSIWRKFIEGRDLLRQKATFALSELVVTSVESDFSNWEQFAAANYMDRLEAEALGNYQLLLKSVTLSAMMGKYLTYVGSRKAGANGAESRPDENYARELMQLFTIGVVQFDENGDPMYDNKGGIVPSYTQQDVEELARVFTGWELDESATRTTMLDYGNRDLINKDKFFDFGPKKLSFADDPIESGTALGDLNKAIQILFEHINTPFFVARQLIQRFVTSNPSREYVQSVAEAFMDRAKAYPEQISLPVIIRGDMQAVLRVILLDESLFIDRRRVAQEMSLAVPFGKLREPVACFTHWAKAFNAHSTSGDWLIKGDDEPLGQVPMRSPSVFNYFRPGYVPPGTGMAAFEPPLVAPEFQIINETTVINYINFMHGCIDKGLGAGTPKDVLADISPWTTMAAQNPPAQLVDELNELLACGQLSTTTRKDIVDAIGTIKFADHRVKTAATMIVCAPEFLTLK